MITSKTVPIAYSQRSETRKEAMTPAVVAECELAASDHSPGMLNGFLTVPVKMGAGTRTRAGRLTP